MHGLKPNDGDKSIDWGKTSPDYATHRPGPPASFFERLAAFGIGREGQTMLDLGTGTGVMARQFARQGANRGKGIGRKLTQTIIDEASELGFHTLISGVAESSAASLHLHKDFGFEVVGTFREVGRKFGKLLDVTYLQKFLH